MINDNNNQWPPLEEDDTQLTKSWQLSPEKFESIDDKISYISGVTKNRQEARNYVSGKLANEQGSGDLEKDMGYIQCQPPRKDLIDLIHIMKKVRTNYQGHVYRDIALIETVIIGYGLDILEGMLTDRGSRIQKEFENFVVEMCIVEAIRTSKLIPSWLKESLDKEHDRFSEWLVRKDQIDDIKPKEKD
jgi:hypothetical protein